MMEEILQRLGLQYEDLTPDEKETLFGWVEVLSNKNEVTVEKIREFVVSLRIACEQELTAYRDTPNNVFGLLALFIPFLGVIKKWYTDQKELGLKMRLKNYMILEALLSSQDKARAEIERQIASMAEKKRG